MAASREVEVKEILQALGTSQDSKDRTKEKEQQLKKLFSYKNKREIYKYMDTIDVSMYEECIIISPSPQDSLEGFTEISKNKQALEFSYPRDITDEELGKAIYEAFGHCTNIYK